MFGFIKNTMLGKLLGVGDAEKLAKKEAERMRQLEEKLEKERVEREQARLAEIERLEKVRLDDKK